MEPEIVRLVRMSFRPERIEDFLQLFSRVAGYIRSCPGCRRLELLGDEADECVLTTYSIWKSEHDLDEYRRSPLFEDTWRRAKDMFADVPSAVSYRVVRSAREIDELSGSVNRSD